MKWLKHLYIILIEMNYKLAYSFLQSHYENWGDDVIKLFSEYVLLFSDPSNNNTNNILEKIKIESGIIIPEAVVKTLLKRLKKEWYIDYASFEEFYLQKKWINLQIDLKKELNTSKLDLINDIETDLKNIWININLDEIIKIFLESDLSEINFEIWEKNTTKHSELLSPFFNYLNTIKNSGKEKYDFVTSILYASLVSKLLIKRDLSETKQDFKTLKVYLDSNIIISLLGFHHEKLSNSIKELIVSLKSLWANLYIYSITVEQVLASLSNYDPNKYLLDIEIDSMYYYIKLKWKKKTDIEMLISNFEYRLLEQEINIDYKYNKTRLDKLEEDSWFIEDVDGLSEYKETNNLWIKHDVWVVYAIKDSRRHSSSSYVNFIEKCKFVFLTSDYWLCRWISNNIIIKKDNYKFPEAILSRNLISYLWFKNPKKWDTGFFDQFVFWSYRKNIISERLRDNFLIELTSNIDKWDVTEEDCYDLLALKDTKDKLLNLELDIQKGASSWRDFSSIINSQQIDLIKKNKEDDKKKLESFHFINKSLWKELEDSNQKIIKIKDNINIKCQNNMNRIFNIIRIVISIIITILVILLFIFLFKWFKLEENGTIISFWLGLLWFLISCIWKNPKAWIMWKIDFYKSELITNCVIKQSKKIWL